MLNVKSRMLKLPIFLNWQYVQRAWFLYNVKGNKTYQTFHRMALALIRDLNKKHKVQHFQIYLNISDFMKWLKFNVL